MSSNKQNVEVKRNPGENVITLARLENLIMQARLHGAPDDARLAVDVIMEIRSPARCKRAVIEWELTEPQQ